MTSKADKAEIKAIFFDLDGTLLPLDQTYFLKKYLKKIAIYATSFGLDPEKTVDGILIGTEAMIRNDGSKTNCEAFWEKFFEYLGKRREDLVNSFDAFYVGGFKELREETQPNPMAVEIVKKAHENGRKVVLATNPVFPMVAQLERMSWLGLSESDFELVTAYENSNYCKPNPEYYKEICQKIGVAPDKCLMIGNDESDDMRGASLAGMECFLVTDHRIMAENFVWTGERGSVEQALHIVQRI